MRLKSEYGALTLPVRLDEDAPRKSVRIDGFVDEEQVPERTCVNVLTSPDLSDLGAGNVLYSNRVELEPGG